MSEVNNNALMIVSKAIQAPQMRDQFVQMLPKDVPVDRFTEVALMAVRQSPELLDADRQTLYDSCLQLARRGLMPDKKEAALVVFSTNVAPKGAKPDYVKKVQAMPMVEGIIKEMGKVGVKAYATSVYENDTIEFWNDDDGQHVLHKPKVFGGRGKRLGAFAAAKMLDGRTYVEAMDMDELERIALRSKQARENNGVKTRGGTWLSDPERMEQKSCLHRARKRMPIIGLESLDDDDINLDAPQPASPPAQSEQSRSAPNVPAGESGGTAGGDPQPPVSMTAENSAQQADGKLVGTAFGQPPPEAFSQAQDPQPEVIQAPRRRRPSALKSVIEQAKASTSPPEQFRDGDII